MNAADQLELWKQNPFFVLGVAPETPQAEVERQAQKLQALLAVGNTGAKTYSTPFGPCERSADLVRAAVAELRDVERRILHELWASLSPPEVEGSSNRTAAPWRDALAAIGWQKR